MQVMQRFQNTKNYRDRLQLRLYVLSCTYVFPLFSFPIVFFNLEILSVHYQEAEIIPSVIS